MTAKSVLTPSVCTCTIAETLLVMVAGTSIREIPVEMTSTPYWESVQRKVQS